MRLITVLTPPLLGAFIGWITNYIAIRMLFRPLRPWRIFGLRLPMTPGVIPARRHDLAVNIGRMVGAQLLTSADIGQAMAEPGFRQELETLTQARLRALLERDLGPLPALVPQRFLDSFEAGADILRWRAVKLLHDYLGRPEFRQGLETAIGDHIDLALSHPLADWLQPDGVRGLESFLSETTCGILSSPQTESWLRDACRKRLAGLKDCHTPLNELLPAGVSKLVIGLLQDEVPGLLNEVRRLAREPGLRDFLAKAISDAITSLISPLGPIATLAKGLFSPERLKDKVAAYLDSREDDLADWLNQDQTQARVREAVAKMTAGLLAKPPAALLAGLGPKDEDALASALAGELAAILRQPQTKASLKPLIAEGVATLTGRDSRLALGDLLAAEGLDGLRGRARAEIATAILSAKGRRLLDSTVTVLLDNILLRQPIGPLAKLLPKEVQKGLGEYLLKQMHDLLVAEAPRLFAFVNIERIVARKVDSLDLLRLEALLLGIMEEQFTYINLFGGLLGFIIGLANLAFISWK